MNRETFVNLKILLAVVLKWGLKRIQDSFKMNLKPKHIFFCMVDHYEPGTGGVSSEIEKQRMTELCEKYPKIVATHKDHFGNIPKRTWFFPPHYHRHYNLKNLVSLCERGFGEIELHLHHGKHQPDDENNLRETILQCIEEYGKYGVFGKQRKYAFIHGDWALDNSRRGKYCGVNSEISILKETGCYADFTFPSPNESNPSKINTIYYAKDLRQRPKSYNHGTDVRKSGNETGDLMIIQGPIYPFLLWDKKFVIRCLGDSISGRPPVNRKRIDRWISTNISIKGKSNCIFVKTHTHGATDSKAVLGQEIQDVFGYLENKYNDGSNYILHYVTAREMYNIIKAIESGECECDPEPFRNYLIEKPQYLSNINIEGASEKLMKMVGKTYQG